MKKHSGILIILILTLAFSSSTLAGNGVVSVPPGYVYLNGVAWNAKVYETGIKIAKEKGYQLICLTNLSAEGKNSLFLIKENYKISKVENEISFIENDMILSGCELVNIKGVNLSEGEYAVWKNGQLQKNTDKLPIR
jgi:hypothetical protein